MSLINEALRKARQAAAEHDEKQAEGPFQPPKAYPSRGPGRTSGLLKTILVAVFAGVVGAAAAWWFLGDHQETSPAAFELEPKLEVVTEEAPALVSSPVPTELPKEDIATEAALTAEPTPITEQPADLTAVDQPVAEPEAPEPVPIESADEESDASNDDRVFVMEATLGEVTLSLGFIVARPANPFAEINGIEVYVGSEIEGFVVESIEADRVTLRDDQGPLVLRVP